MHTLLTEFQFPFKEIYSDCRLTQRFTARLLQYCGLADFWITDEQDFKQQVIIQRHSICEPSLSNSAVIDSGVSKSSAFVTEVYT